MILNSASDTTFRYRLAASLTATTTIDMEAAVHRSTITIYVLITCGTFATLD